MDESQWAKIRTCSRVSAGVCINCHHACYYGAWRRESPSNSEVLRKLGRTKTETLCLECYERQYQPEAYAARLKAIEEAEKERLRLIANPPPGSIRTANGGLMGPVQDLVTEDGMVFHNYRQVLQDGLFDTEAVKPSESSGIDFFQFPKKPEDNQ